MRTACLLDHTIAHMGASQSNAAARNLPRGKWARAYLQC